MYLYEVSFFGPEAKRYARLKDPVARGLSKPDPIKEDEITAASRAEAEDIANLRGSNIKGAACFMLKPRGRIRKAGHV